MPPPRPRHPAGHTAAGSTVRLSGMCDDGHIHVHVRYSDDVRPDSRSLRDPQVLVRAVLRDPVIHPDM